jgi:hypothetical protein
MELQDNYPYICPVCGLIQDAEPSSLMKLGVNSGHTFCSNAECSEMLHLQIHADNERMDAETWEVYVDRIRLTNEDVTFFEELTKSA